MNKENNKKDQDVEFPLLKIDEVPIMPAFGNCPYAVGFGQPAYISMRVENKYRSALDKLIENEGELPIVHPFTYSENDKNKYNSNNGVLCVIKEDGVYVTPYRKKLEEHLDKKGFKYSMNIFVPLSNNEKILDPELEKRWEELIKERLEELLK